MIQYSVTLLDDFVAPEITKFTTATLISLDAELIESGNWMLLFGLRDVLGQKLKPLHARGFRQFARRTVAAVRSYEEVRFCLDQFFESHVIDSPKLAHYFQALDAAETCLLQCQIAYEVFYQGKLISGLSYLDCSKSIKDLANGIKHFTERTIGERTNLALLPLWFENQGLVSSDGRVGFDELAVELKGMVETSKIMLGNC